MRAKTYNHETDCWEYVELPDAAGTTYLPNMYIECASCGTCITDKKYIASRNLMNSKREGYLICKDCYAAEDNLPF